MGPPWVLGGVVPDPARGLVLFSKVQIKCWGFNEQIEGDVVMGRGQSKLYVVNLYEGTVESVETKDGKVSVSKIRESLDYPGSSDTGALDVYLVRMDDRYYKRLVGLLDNEEEGEVDVSKRFFSWIEGGKVEQYGETYSEAEKGGLAEALMELLEEGVELVP